MPIDKIKEYKENSNTFSKSLIDRTKYDTIKHEFIFAEKFEVKESQIKKTSHLKNKLIMRTKKYIYSLGLLLILSNSYSQITEDEILYTRGTTLLEVINNEDFYMWAYHNENKTESERIKTVLNKLRADALKSFDEIIDKYPNSRQLLQSLFQKGNIEFDFKNYKIAKETLIKVVNFKQEGFNNYKNKAYRTLAQIEMEEKNYLKAIEYLDASKNLKKTYTCGTEYETDKEQLENMYIKCYDELNKIKK